MNNIENSLSLSTKAKRRMRTTKEEMNILENYYQANSNPNKEQKQEIAQVVQMGERNVHFWFQNRRAKENKKKKLSRQYKQKGKAPTSNKVSSKRENNNNNNNKTEYNQNLKLPPISTIMIPDIKNLSISFYFHHSKFGIENSMLQWLEFNQQQQQQQDKKYSV